MIGRGSEEQKEARLIRAYQAVSLTVAAFALFWTVMFYINGRPILALAEFFPVVAALVCFALVTRGRLDLSLIVAEFSFLIFVIGFCLIFDVPQIIAFLSGSTTLLPGTVILTGTPEGVGMARTPPRWLRPGDEVTIEIEKIGALTNRVVLEGETA